MIPRDYITEWRAKAPWVQDYQVEQDLVISKALVEIFSHPLLNQSLAFRGGTALYKLHLKPAARYSEDIDLVQIDAEPAGPTINALRDTLESWLGEPKRKQSESSVTLIYRFNSEEMPPIPLRLKVEINSREHFSLYGLTSVPFSVSSRYFEGICHIRSYELDELLGTKLRALYQRKKGRDLFDLAVALENQTVNPTRIIEAFLKYMEEGGHKVSRAQFEQNMAQKLQDPQFTADIGPLLAPGFSWDFDSAFQAVSENLIQRLPGDPWKGTN